MMLIEKSKSHNLKQKKQKINLKIMLKKKQNNKQILQNRMMMKIIIKPEVNLNLINISLEI